MWNHLVSYFSEEAVSHDRPISMYGRFSQDKSARNADFLQTSSPTVNVTGGATSSRRHNGKTPLYYGSQSHGEPVGDDK
ncbi:hypothetical protein RRG08_014770 [Elysia crispata]|uniref:Uncharacterized protein n=1 Tax=Elysia crispata TaxID=231223 RepID=A0AAE1AVD1_9GAST|nr:hypothetical protein RRG08_014770 [Elysia crispata]